MQHLLFSILVIFSLVTNATSFHVHERISVYRKIQLLEPRLPTWSSRCPETSLSASERNNLSSSDKERRDEEKRRKQRKDEVVIGKTSAKKGETDYALDPDTTEQEFLRQASNVEQEVYLMTLEGKKMLNSVRNTFEPSCS